MNWTKNLSAYKKKQKEKFWILDKQKNFSIYNKKNIRKKETLSMMDSNISFIKIDMKNFLVYQLEVRKANYLKRLYYRSYPISNLEIVYNVRLIL